MMSGWLLGNYRQAHKKRPGECARAFDALSSLSGNKTA
jgi:hypothetical protein